MSRTIAVLGAGPGFGRAVAYRFGAEGFRVALVARTPAKLDRFTAELADAGIEAAGFPADLADRTALPALLSAITDRFGAIDVLEYAPAGPEWLPRQVDIRATTVDSLEFPLNMLLRSPIEAIGRLLPDMLARDSGTILFGLPTTATPVPQVGNVATVAAAARAYLHTLHTALLGTGVYAGLVQVAGMVGGSEAAEHVQRHWDPSLLPEPLDPARLADAAWELHSVRTDFERVVG
jgi:NADP-dependent 3-hydroxy acid dehydrogenase YdfG